MGINERREREKIERRRAILNCARELILTQGIEKVSMEDIALKAELSKATLYLYFPGKEVIFNEICEESARVFLEHFKPMLGSMYTGLDAMRMFWRGYNNLFGNSGEMILVFKIRNFLNPGQPFISMEEYGKSQNVEAILETLKTIIDRCKSDGIFDPGLDSETATRLLLSLFSNFVDNAARTGSAVQKTANTSKEKQSFQEELIKSFQIILYGFAKEGLDRSLLNIKNLY